MIDSFVCFDIETTGLTPTKDKIIEIGALKIVNGELIGRFSEFINPHMRLPDRISELTGIDDDMLLDARESSEVIRDFVEFCGDYPIIGHNIQFDYSFVKVYSSREKLKFEKKALDTLKLSRIFHKELPSKSLESMCHYYGIKNNHAHRAFDDARATTKLYYELVKNFYRKEPKQFEPVSLIYKVKKEESITNPQKNYLNDLLKYHKIEYGHEINLLTKSEASKLIDKIILENGRII